MLKAPFPYFGGKSKAAALLWSRFGDVPNYVDPFVGSFAVGFARPHWNYETAQFNGAKWYRTETINDLSPFITNFYRAVSADPDCVAHYADSPVNELDLHARHRWLVDQHDAIEQLRNDPDFYDAKIAGWWVWGQSAWIGSGWCKNAEVAQLPHLGNLGRGTHAPTLHAKRPHLMTVGKGIHALSRHFAEYQPRPNLRPGQGVQNRQQGIYAVMNALKLRLRRVRVTCGDWSRVLGESVTVKIGLTGVFLDPPYPESDNRKMGIYAEDSADVAHDVREWAIENGDNPKLRIAYCGYEGQDMPESWECVAWKANGGYSNQKRNGNNDNASRERIWFSPHCIKPNSKVNIGLFAPKVAS